MGPSPVSTGSEEGLPPLHLGGCSWGGTGFSRCWRRNSKCWKVLARSCARLSEPRCYCRPHECSQRCGGFLSPSLSLRCCLQQISTTPVSDRPTPQKGKGKLSICNFFFPSALCQKVVTSALLTYDSHYYLGVITHHSISRPEAFHPSRQEGQLLLKMLFSLFFVIAFS